VYSSPLPSLFSQNPIAQRPTQIESQRLRNAIQIINQAGSCRIEKQGAGLLLLAISCQLLPLILSGCGASLSSGTGSGSLIASPHTVAFSNLQVGDSATAEVSVVNRGVLPAQISNLSISGKYFSIQNQGNLPISVAAGGTYQITVQFSPTDTGNMSGDLTITSNPSLGVTSVVHLSGDAVKNSTQSALLTVNSAAVSFGDVTVNTVATQAVTLTSKGSFPVTIESIRERGRGFATSGLIVPTTLAPGQSTTLNLQFDPASVGNARGTVSITSNSFGRSGTAIQLTGTGIAAAPGAPGGSAEVQLNWDAPNGSTDPIAGYNIYRSLGGSSQYLRINQSVEAQTAFLDSTVQKGSTYDYYVTSVDPSGLESVPSNTAVAEVQ
jgi:Abnormal spindle-like microcephaly-assoc'd, ASPM-SPD-2-Hydin